MLVTLAMFFAFARGRIPIEIVSLLTIGLIAVGLYFFPLPHTEPMDGVELAFSGFGHYALITICALMVMGRGLVTTGALDPAARLLERVFKVNQQLGLLPGGVSQWLSPRMPWKGLSLPQDLHLNCA
jgi:C4-dicarboxylate transporter